MTRSDNPGVPFPAGEHRLDRKLARRLPRVPAVYGASIVDSKALAEAGIAGPPPVRVYVGRAVGADGLRGRLRSHAEWPWWELIDLLASRRIVLPAWWSHAEKNVRGTLDVPLLADVSLAQARAWQHRNLRWGWTTDPSIDLPKLEVDLIAAHRPLINRKGQGYGAQPPMQLQKIGAYERERAWWLFHASWLAVLTLRPTDWVADCWRSGPWFLADRVAHDEDGWPTPLAEGTEQTIRIPWEWSARETLVDLAPPELREAVMDESTAAEQATAWWAAYAGHPYLRDSQPHEDALRSALAREPSAYRSPPDLPSGRKLEQLLQLVRQLPHVSH
jgi:hypothetical protein